MSLKMKILAGAAGIAAAAGLATPAAAQYYPQPNYGYGYNNQGGVLGAIVNSVLGYGRYPQGNYGYNTYGNQRVAIDQCARAVEARIGGGYNQGYGYGYNNYGYNQGYGGGRVLGITRIDRRSSGGLRVRGVASSGAGYGGYGYNAGADLSFRCDIDRYGRIRDIDLDRRSAYYRGY